MIQILKSKTENHTFEWIDLVNPTSEELDQIAKEYNLHPLLVQDCLQPEHLPKYELIDEVAFIILRVYDQFAAKEADTIQELTRKIAIFYSSKFVITIHRTEQSVINEIKEKLIDTGKCVSSDHLLNKLIKSSFSTYEAPGHGFASQLDFLESKIFLAVKTQRILKDLYSLKRKIDVIKRILLISKEIIDPLQEDNPYSRDIRDSYLKLDTMYDSMRENANHLLNFYFSFTSQKTNEVMRILTVFSVFFMPLTFIVGIYGMNFEFMPELKMKYGYPAVMILMVVMIILIFIWFKRKKWL